MSKKAVNKVVVDGVTKLDLTGDSVTPQTLLAGATAHNAAGEQIEGAVAVAPASNTTPSAPAAAGNVGSENAFARGDHVHPAEVFWIHATVDSSKAVTADKTPAEVKEAVLAGKLCLLDVGNAYPTLIGGSIWSNQSGVTFTAVKGEESTAPDAGTVYSTICSFGLNTWQSLSEIVIPRIVQPKENNAGKFLASVYDEDEDAYFARGRSIAPADIGAAAAPTLRQITLTAAAWNSSTKRQTITCSGVLADAAAQEIHVAPADASYDSAWNSCGVLCVAQSANSLTFQCDTIPTGDITVYVSIYAL